MRKAKGKPILTAGTRSSKKQKNRVRESSARHRSNTRRALAKVAIKRALSSPRQKSDKIASMTVMVCRLKGATLAELCKMTGWQPHSVRAAISAVLKKKLKLDVVSENIGGERVYRVIVP